jgi:adenine-specific DNA-methyltransferase
MFKRHAAELIANDIEDYAREISTCYLANRGDVPQAELAEIVAQLNLEVAAHAPPAGFIGELYAPADLTDIRPGERVFYTPENAYRLDAYRQLIADQPLRLRPFLMGPLLAAASVHANTAGVFKGFYKDRDTGVGKLGGSGGDALPRITTPITLSPPVLSRFQCDYQVAQQDANELVNELPALDVAYLDPPYNQHPYGSNYFMLNLLVNYERPRDLSCVSGIPAAWRRSGYNVRRRALPRLHELLEKVDATFVILSFNDEGFISPAQLRELLDGVGEVTEQRQPHTTFRGCRNLRNRSASVTEHVYLIEKGA